MHFTDFCLDATYLLDNQRRLFDQLDLMRRCRGYEQVSLGIPDVSYHPRQPPVFMVIRQTQPTGSARTLRAVRKVPANGPARREIDFEPVHSGDSI